MSTTSFFSSSSEIYWFVLAWSYLINGNEPPVNTVPESFGHRVEIVAKATGVIPWSHYPAQRWECRSIYIRLKDSPDFSYALLFPSVKDIDLQLEFGRLHLKWLEGKKNLYPVDEVYWDARIEDMNWRLGIYQLAREMVKDSQITINPKANGFVPSVANWTQFNSWTRSELRQLRDRIGDDIYLGILPPIVPVHQFRRIW